MTEWLNKENRRNGVNKSKTPETLFGGESRERTCAAVKFAVIGHPVAHSLSPKMHEANFRALGIDATYTKFDVLAEDLASFLNERKKEGYCGINVTVPHKQTVMQHLDSLDESAAEYGSCNTVKFMQDGSLRGYNTDIIGFVASLSSHGFTLRGKRIGIAGCGGAGGAIALACVKEGAAETLVAARTRESESRLIERIRKKCQAANIARLDLGDTALLRSCDLLVNASPVGLRPDDTSVFPPGSFKRGQFVLDIIPKRDLPPTAAAAQREGAFAIGGLDFLVAQGAASFEIWTGLKPDIAAMRQALSIE